MEKLAGKVIDFYDDKTASVLKTRYRSYNELPDFIKKGSFLAIGEKDRLRDSLFALVMHNGEETLKKFACTDACNTALSVIYLVDHAKDILPEAATKVAARNLVIACKQYDIKPPEVLEKMAGIIPAEANPHIDITNMSAPSKDTPVAVHALTKEAKYPIQSYEQVQTAVRFFEKNASKLHPEQRREYCLNITKRAEEFGIPVSSTIRKYAANTYAPKAEIRAAVASRMEKVSEDNRAIYIAIFEKMASVPPGVFASALAQLDERTGAAEYWDNGIPDPYAAVLAEKVASYAYTGTQGYVDEEDLKRLAEFNKLLEHAFDADFAKGFHKDPVGTFKALPDPEKNTIIKLVSAAKTW